MAAPFDLALFSLNSRLLEAAPWLVGQGKVGWGQEQTPAVFPELIPAVGGIHCESP